MHRGGNLVAALDVGSNTVHLLVVKLHDGRPEEVDRRVSMPRVGRAVDDRGEIGPEKRFEVCGTLREFAGVARAAGADPLLLGATAAVRRARDRDTALAEFSAAAGVQCRLIGEQREAQLSYAGALGGGRGGRITLVCDVGGGSTECAVGSGTAPDAVLSVPVGSGTATVRWMPSDPAGEAERKRATIALAQLFADAPATGVSRGIVTGGTASHLPHLLNGGAVLDAGDFQRCRLLLAREPSAEVASRYRIDPERARVLAAGVEIIDAVRRRFQLASFEVTHRGLREGMALAWVERGDNWYQEP